MLIAPTGGLGSPKPLPLIPQSKKSSRAIDIHPSFHQSHTYSPTSSTSSISSPLSPQSPFIKNGQIDQDKLRRYKTQLCPRGEDCQFGLACEFAHGRDELRRSLAVTDYAPVLCTIPGCRDSSCKFSHNLSESQYHPDVYKTKMCSYWTKEGTCARASYCTFAHGKDDLRIKKRPSVSGTGTVQSPIFSSRAGLHLHDEAMARRAGDDRGRRHSTGGLSQHIGLGLGPISLEPKRDWFDMRFKGNSSLDHMDQYDKSHHSDEYDKEGSRYDLTNKEDDFGVNLIGPSTIKEGVEQDEFTEAIALLTGDMDRLAPYSLTPLKQLRTLLQDARAAVDEVISNYDNSHPTRTCTKCSAPVRSIILPCHHAVECDRCLADDKNCPHCHCNISHHSSIKRDLPACILDGR